MPDNNKVGHPGSSGSTAMLEQWRVVQPRQHESVDEESLLPPGVEQLLPTTTTTARLRGQTSPNRSSTTTGSTTLLGAPAPTCSSWYAYAPLMLEHELAPEPHQASPQPASTDNVDDEHNSNTKDEDADAPPASVVVVQQPTDEEVVVAAGAEDSKLPAAPAPSEPMANVAVMATVDEKQSSTVRIRTWGADPAQRLPSRLRHYTRQQPSSQLWAVDQPHNNNTTDTASPPRRMLPPPASVARVTPLLQERLGQEWPSSMPSLLWRAVLEECHAAWWMQWQSLLSADQQQPHALKSDHVPPSITTDQGDYDDDEENGCLFQWTTVTFTLAQLVQRIKQGCALAWRQREAQIIAAMQLQQQQEQQQYSQQSQSLLSNALPLGEARRSRRTTTTIADATTSGGGTSSSNQPTAASLSSASSLSLLWKVQPGGRVAQALLGTEDSLSSSLNKNNNNSHKAQDTIAQPPATNPDETEPPPNGNINNSNDAPVEEAEDGDSHNSNDDDNNDADDDDEVMELEEEELEEEEQDGEEEEEDEDTVLVARNPYLQPDSTAVLEWLGRKVSKSLTPTDLQPLLADLVHFAILPTTKKKKNARRPVQELGLEVDQLLSTTDRLVLAQLLLRLPQQPLWPRFTIDSDLRIVADFLFGNNDKQNKRRLVLQPLLPYDVDDTDLTVWEIQSLSRTPWALRLVHPEAVKQIRDERARVAQQHAAHQHERRVWEGYRNKAVLNGYCSWFNSSQQGDGRTWTTVAAAALQLSVREEEKPAGEHDNSAAALAESSIYTPSQTTTTDDLALAQSLAAAAATTSGRRKTRRDGGGVFYGNQSSMTAKQLMDAVLRIISSAQPLSLAGLLHVAPDDSSDPMRRIRMAVGRLLWKRNQLARLDVHIEWSDAPIWNQLCQGPIWRPPSVSSLRPGSALDGHDETTKDGSDDDLEALIRYVRTLHQTELQLRAMVMAKLTEIPVALIATAADERAGSLEAMDNLYFEQDDDKNLEWQSIGHELLGSRILRPAMAEETSDSTLCFWFEVTAFIPSLESSGVSEDPPEIGRAKEPRAVERRIRFLANPVNNRNSDNGRPMVQTALILTEAQVRAGLKAAEMDSNAAGEDENPDALVENPFASGNSEISLLGTDPSEPPMTAVIVGHECVASRDDHGIQHKILLLPQKGSPTEHAFWATLNLTSETGSVSCTTDGNGRLYTIQQRDFHPSSVAYQECLAIVRFLQRHPRGLPFLEPVDPVALGIPDYFAIIQNPMDVSTLFQKLERGEYASIPAGHLKGHSPVTRMLNGPFRRDVELIFDNAMLFNPPDDWIHQAAAAIKKTVIKKIEQASSSAERSIQQRKIKESVYAEYDSDVDMYAYESDEDDEYGGNKRKRKRKSGPGVTRTPAKEDSSLRVVERGIRLQMVLSESVGRRGPFGKLPIASNAADFSLPSDWSCRHKILDAADAKVGISSDASSLPELDELSLLHRQLEETEHVGIRRSTRAHDYENDAKEQNSSTLKGVEYFLTRFPSGSDDKPKSPGNRFEVELARERLHESHYAKIYQTVYKSSMVKQSSTDLIGVYSNGFFPPYLGRVVPLMSPYATTEKTVWEIREQFVVSALKWVIRGLIHSEHLTEVEPLDSPTGGVIIPNHLYYIDESQTPFDTLNTKELTRRKRADAGGEASSEEEVELSEYEKARAERVARNKERLQALGLA